MAVFDTIEAKNAPKENKHQHPCKCKDHRPKPVVSKEKELEKLFDKWAVKNFNRSVRMTEAGLMVRDVPSVMVKRHGTVIKLSRKRGCK